MTKAYTLDCPVARALDIVGERWSLLILRDLFEQGPRRFQDFETSLEGVAPTTLSARIKSLDQRGIIEARLYQAHPPRYEYRLTEKGKALGPILQSLRTWGEVHTRPPARGAKGKSAGLKGQKRVS